MFVVSKLRALLGVPINKLVVFSFGRVPHKGIPLFGKTRGFNIARRPLYFLFFIEDTGVSQNWGYIPF